MFKKNTFKRNNGYENRGKLKKIIRLRISQ